MEGSMSNCRHSCLSKMMERGLVNALRACHEKTTFRLSHSRFTLQAHIPTTALPGVFDEGSGVTVAKCFGCDDQNGVLVIRAEQFDFLRHPLFCLSLWVIWGKQGQAFWGFVAKEHESISVSGAYLDRLSRHAFGLCNVLQVAREEVKERGGFNTIAGFEGIERCAEVEAPLGKSDRSKIPTSVTSLRLNRKFMSPKTKAAALVWSMSARTVSAT